MKPLRWILIALAMVMAAPVLAADLQKGFEAGKRGDYATALKEFRPLANQGDALAQFALGLMYYNGQGVLQDHVMAHMWYNIAGRSLGNARHNRDIIAKKMTSAQISKALRMAKKMDKGASRKIAPIIPRQGCVRAAYLGQPVPVIAAFTTAFIAADVHRTLSLDKHDEIILHFNTDGIDAGGFYFVV